MEKLEKKIIKAVYTYETKRTALSAGIKVIAIGSLITAIAIVTGVLLQILSTQETFSVIDIFREDAQAFHTYIFDVLYVFMVEIPKLHAAILILGVIMLVIAIVLIIKHFTRIKNKATALIHYWTHKH